MWTITITADHNCQAPGQGWSKSTPGHPHLDNLNIISLLSLTKEMTLESFFTTTTHHQETFSRLPVAEMSWEKNSKKKPSVHNIFCFLVNFVRHTGPMVTMVTRYTGGLSQFPVVKKSWEKNSKRNPVFTTFFVFWSILSDPLIPWSPWVTRYKASSGWNVYKCQPICSLVSHQIVKSSLNESFHVVSGLQGC